MKKFLEHLKLKNIIILAFFAVVALGALLEGETDPALGAIALGAIYYFLSRRKNKNALKKYNVSFDDYEDDERYPEKKKYNYSKKYSFADRYVVIDFETTGFNPVNDRIIEIGAVRFEKGQEVNRYTTLVNPQVHIHSGIEKHTGISNDMVEFAPLIQDVLPELLEFIGNDIVVAHYATFDISFLLENIERCGLNHEFKNKVSDTLYFARKYVHDTPNHKLPTLKKHFGLSSHKSHRAADDCLVAGKIYWELKLISETAS